MKLSVKMLKDRALLLCYFSMLSYSVLGHVGQLNSPLGLLANTSLILVTFLFLLSLKNYTIRGLLLLVALIMAAGLSAYSTRDLTIARTLLLLLAFRFIEFKRIVKVDILARFSLVLIGFLLFLLNITSDSIFFFNEFVKHSYGFTNPNAIGMHTMILCFDLVYVGKHGMNIAKTSTVLAVAFLNLILFSRTVAYILVAFVILCYLAEHRRNFYKITLIKAIIVNGAAVFSLIVLALTISYSAQSTVSSDINNATSNRIENIVHATETLGITPFGSNMSNLGKTLDNFYVYSFYAFGFVLFSMLIIGFSQTIKIQLQRKDYTLAIIIFLFLAYGLSERLWMFIDYNVYLFAMVAALYTREFVQINNSTCSRAFSRNDANSINFAQ